MSISDFRARNAWSDVLLFVMPCSSINMIPVIEGRMQYRSSLCKSTFKYESVLTRLAPATANVGAVNIDSLARSVSGFDASVTVMMMLIPTLHRC